MHGAVLFLHHHEIHIGHRIIERALHDDDVSSRTREVPEVFV
jgi:hypothetical protein